MLKYIPAFPLKNVNKIAKFKNKRIELNNCECVKHKKNGEEWSLYPLITLNNQRYAMIYSQPQSLSLSRRKRAPRPRNGRSSLANSLSAEFSITTCTYG